MPGKSISYYVSTEGDNSNAGDTPEAPFESLDTARDAIRELGQNPATEGIEVNIMGGDYQLKSPFELKNQDGGNPHSPIIYKAYNGQKVRLLGGERLTGFGPVLSQDVLERLPEQSRDQVVQCDLNAQGITDFGKFRPRGFSRSAAPAHMELFYDFRRMEVARWPSGEYAKIDAPAEIRPEGDDHGGEIGSLEAGFFFLDRRPTRWKSLGNVWIYGFWGWDWADSFERIASYDSSSGRIKTHPPYGLYGFRKGQRFYFLNILEELDQPGEYYVDTERGMLYFWPPGPLEGIEIFVSILEDPLIRMCQADHLHFEGIAFEYSRGDGIKAEDCSNISVSGCRTRNLGNNGIVVSEGEHNTIRSCDIHHTGDGGIILSGGNRKTLEKCHHLATNNHIHHMGSWTRCNQSAIWISGVGIVVSHNEIHDGPHNAINLSGNEHSIDYNHIHHVCGETGDVGAFYMGRDWTERGNKIRHNFFHDTQGFGMGSNAVYLDDCASGSIVYGNVFYKCTRATFIGGGRNHRIENNIFVRCEPAIQIDGRGLDPKPVWQEMVHETMRRSLEAVDHHQPPYSTSYPDLKELDTFYANGVGVPPEGNLITRNICVGGQWLVTRWHAHPSKVAVQNNFIDQDPGFFDEAGMDFRLPEDSPVNEIGFKPIPFEKIGLFQDDHRQNINAPQTS